MTRPALYITSSQSCPECRGSGKPRVWTFWGWLTKETCEVCKGRGMIAARHPVPPPPPPKKCCPVRITSVRTLPPKVLCVFVLACCLLGQLVAETVRNREPIRDSLESCELNFFYDDCGKLVFRQLIWRNEWDEIVAWRLVKSDTMLPKRDGREWVCCFADGETLREVRSKVFVDSFTQYDPELNAREWFPKEMRRELSTATLRRSKP